MKEQFLNSTLGFLQKYNNYSEKDLMKLKYGLEGIYLTITKLVIILLVACVIGIFKEVVIVLVLFNIIRYFGFGFHAEKSSECLVLSLINFILIPYLFLNIEISTNTSLGIAGLCLINYLLFAPADTVKRPFKDKKKRIIRKFLTLGVGIAFSLIIFVLNNNYVTALLLSALIIEVIMICPLTYALFRQPYNNYKK